MLWKCCLHLSLAASSWFPCNKGVWDNVALLQGNEPSAEREDAAKLNVKRGGIGGACRSVMTGASLSRCSLAVNLNALPKPYVAAQHLWLFPNVLLVRFTLQASSELGQVTQALLDCYFPM